MDFLQKFRTDFLVKFWAPIPAVIALGIISAFYFGIIGTHWAITGELTRWGGHALEAFGIDLSQWGYYQMTKLDGNVFTRAGGMMILGMFAGCIAAALISNNVKLRMPTNKTRMIQALIGGIIAGFGARLGMGCNLASFFTGIPQFTFHAWMFTFAMIGGVYLGTKFTLLPFLKSKVKLQKVCKTKAIQKNESREKRFFSYGLLVYFAIILISLYLIFIQNSTRLGLAMIFGSVFGLIISKAQICFTSAFRDIFTTGRSELAKAIVIGMAIATIGVFIYIMMGQAPKTMWAGPNAIIGGALFGFGIVLAGGCECGWMYRAVEGQVHFWIVGIGNVIGTMLLAFVWDDISTSMTSQWPKINLLEVFGNYGGLVINYSLLIILFLTIIYLEKRYLKKLKTKK